VDDTGLEMLSGLTKLVFLDLSVCKRITDTGLGHLTNLDQLTTLLMPFCVEITDAGMASVAQLKHLTTLNLDGCNITDAGIAQLLGLGRLRWADITTLHVEMKDDYNRVWDKWRHTKASELAADATRFGVRPSNVSLLDKTRAAAYKEHLTALAAELRRNKRDSQNKPPEPDTGNAMPLEDQPHLDSAFPGSANGGSEHQHPYKFKIGDHVLYGADIDTGFAPFDVVFVNGTTHGAVRSVCENGDIEYVDGYGKKGVQPRATFKAIAGTVENIVDKGPGLVLCEFQPTSVSAGTMFVNEDALRAQPQRDSGNAHQGFLTGTPATRPHPDALLDETLLARVFSNLPPSDLIRNIRNVCKTYRRVVSGNMPPEYWESQPSMTTIKPLWLHQSWNHRPTSREDAWILQTLIYQNLHRIRLTHTHPYLMDTVVSYWPHLKALEVEISSDDEAAVCEAMDHIAQLKELTSLTLPGSPGDEQYSGFAKRSLQARDGDDSPGMQAITDKCLQMIVSLKQLTSLGLPGNNAITDFGMVHIGKLMHLTSLDLSGSAIKTDLHPPIHQRTSITNEGLRPLANLKQLASLTLSACDNITDEGLQHLVGLTELVHLDLSGITGIGRHGLQHLLALTSLTNLNLFCCYAITDDCLVGICQLVHLTRLNLSMCGKITDDGMKQLDRLTQLTSLNLSYCMKITDKCMPYISTLESLNTLNLHKCRELTDGTLPQLAVLAQLRDLDIRGIANIQWPESFEILQSGRRRQPCRVLS